MNQFTKRKFKNQLCHFCNNRPAETVDHIVPKNRGGSNRPVNLVGACSDCNENKGDMSYTVFCRFIRRFGTPEKHWRGGVNKEKRIYGKLPDALRPKVLPCEICRCKTNRIVKRRSQGLSNVRSNHIGLCFDCNERHSSPQTLRGSTYKRYSRRFGEPEQNWFSQTNKYKRRAISKIFVSAGANAETVVERKWGDQGVKLLNNLKAHAN